MKMIWTSALSPQGPHRFSLRLVATLRLRLGAICVLFGAVSFGFSDTCGVLLNHQSFKQSVDIIAVALRNRSFNRTNFGNYLVYHLRWVVS